MEVSIDNVNGRLVIPKGFRDTLGIKDKVYLYFDSEKKALYITTNERYTSIELINKRLNNKDLTKSERNFLEKLKGII